MKVYFGCVLSLFFTNLSFGTFIPIKNTIDIKCGDLSSQMFPPSLNEEPKMCIFDNPFFDGDDSDGSKSEETNKDFTISVEEISGTSSDKNLDFLKRIEYFKENGEFLNQNSFFHDLNEEEKKRVDKTIERFCGMYSDSVVKGTKFIGLEKEGVFVGKGITKARQLFLGRREGSSMFGLLKGAQKDDFLIGYFNMNDEGDVKNAGIIFNPSANRPGFSIKIGESERVLLYFENPTTIECVYNQIKENRKFQRLNENLENVKKQVLSMFENVKPDFNTEEFLHCMEEFPVKFKIITQAQFCSSLKNDKYFGEVESFESPYTVYGDALSFPIYLNGEKREGLLFFIEESKGVFYLCFGLQTFEKGMCVFAPLLVVSFSERGQTCNLFDYKKYSNSCEFNYKPVHSSFFDCNLALPGGKEIVINGNFDKKKVYISSPLDKYKIQRGEESGNSLRGLIQSSDLSFRAIEENRDFSLILPSSFTDGVCLEFPCLKNEDVFDFFSSPSGSFTYSLKSSIKEKNKEIDTMDNFIFVCKYYVLLVNKDCINKDIINAKMFNNDKTRRMEANFYYPREFRSVDSFFIFLVMLVNGVVSVGRSVLPFMLCLENFKNGNWYKNVDKKTVDFLTDVFSNSDVETDSIKEDEKELNIDNNINKADNNINEEKKGKEIDDVSIQKKGTKKIGYKHEANIKKRERKKRKKEKQKLNSIESTESKNSNKISNGLKKGENLDFKQGEYVTIEYFLEGKDGKKEKGEIKYTIEEDKKEFFGEKRRIVILSKEKKLPPKFKCKGSVSEILKSGEKKFPIIHKLLTMALFNLSCAKILNSSIKMSKIRNDQIRNRDVLEVYIAHNTETEIGNQIRLLVAYDKAEKTFYALDSLCHYDK